MMRGEEYKKVLRKQIMAAASKRGWDYDTFHDLMESWGYGRSLRKLKMDRLKDLLGFLNGETEKNPADLDEQGRYLWNLMKQAGWDWSRLRMLLLKKYSASHWNALGYEEKRAVISMMKKYAAKTAAK